MIKQPKQFKMTSKRRLSSNSEHVSAVDTSIPEHAAEIAEEKSKKHPRPSDEPLTHHDAGEFHNLVRHKTTAEQAAELEIGKINPFTGGAFSPRYFDILKIRRELPVHAQRNEFLKIYQENQVMVFVGETGSGKTTQIPQFVLFDEMPHLQNTQVACTQTVSYTHLYLPSNSLQYNPLGDF